MADSPRELRLARSDDTDAIDRLMKESIAGIFPAFMATMPGLQLYERYGFVVTGYADILLPDGVVLAGAAMEKPIS